jgi:hypothetical protein
MTGVKLSSQSERPAAKCWRDALNAAFVSSGLVSKMAMSEPWIWFRRRMPK